MSPTKGTILLAVGIGVLVIAVWVATLLMPNPHPLTVEAATAKVMGHLDRIESTLPAGSVLDRSEEVTQGACPIEERGDQAKILRVLSVDPELDRVGWAATLHEVLPEKDGWVVRATTLDSRENLRIRIVGRDLIVINIIATGESGQAQIAMRSTSECRQPN